MPDLEKAFNVGGATIDLNVTGTDADSRRLIINEVMWAVDNAFVGAARYDNQQWIEIYNPSSIPVPHANISLEITDNPSGLNPPDDIAAGTADRLSNIPSYTSTWDVKGQSGTSTENDANPPVIIGANPTFISMYREGDHQHANDGKGYDKSNWTVSDRAFLPGFIGTPGGPNTRGGLPGARGNPGTDTPRKSTFIINEIGNLAGDGDWVELKNITDSEQSLNKYALSLVTGYDKTKNPVANEAEIIRFADIKVAAKGVILLVNADPLDTSLAAGFNVKLSAADQAFGIDKNIRVSHRA